MLNRIINDNNASFVPIAYFVLTIIVCGALYSLFFLEIGFPSFLSFIPNSDSKTLIMMGIRGLLLIILFVGIICLLREGIKREA